MGRPGLLAEILPVNASGCCTPPPPMGAPCMGRKRSPRSWPRHAIALSSNAWLALLDFDFALMTSSVPEQSLKLGREARLCLMWTCLPMPHFGATPVPLDDFLGMGTGPFAVHGCELQGCHGLARPCLSLPSGLHIRHIPHLLDAVNRLQSKPVQLNLS